VLRIHLGIYGKWGFADFVDEPPTAIGQVRARFIAGHRIADLRGPTACDLIDGHELLEITKRLGPDPLNADPKQTEVERFVAKVQKSTKSIALLLMDQSVIAGVGNVYRAELLFRAGLEPHRPGSSIAGETLREIWNDAAYLMRFGVDTGIMVTRDELLGSVPDFDERYFVYKRTGEACRVCGRAVSLEMLGGRKLYWCANCQS
jgi:endonuclease-8